MLYIIPNGTSVPPNDLVVPVLETLVQVDGARHIDITGVNFRDGVVG